MTTLPPLGLPPVDLLLALAISATVIALIHHLFARQGETQSLLKIGTDESGAAYSLPLVLTVPIYALMLSTVVEVTLVLGCRIGVQYAAYAAARAATVWVPAEIPERERMGMIHLAAANAMTPFASGHPQHVTPHQGSLVASGSTADDLIEAYKTYSSGAAPEEYLRRKWRYAAVATDVALEIESDEYDSPATVVVTYEVPMNVPLVGRFLGRTAPWGANYNTYKLTARATLGLERPKSEEQTLGITYGRDLGFESSATVVGNLDAPRDDRPDSKSPNGGTAGDWESEGSLAVDSSGNPPIANTDEKESSRKLLNRVFGTLQVAGGSLTIVAGGALCSSGVGCLLGGPLIAIGIDSGIAGARQIRTGEVTNTLKHSALVYASDGNETFATVADIAIDITTPAGAIKIAGALAKGANRAGKLLSASVLARSFQGSGRFPGIDRFRDIVLKKGTIVLAGEPGLSGFATTTRALDVAGRDATKLFQGLQVPARQGKYRPVLTAFEILEDTPAAFGFALKNTQYGKGGLPQLFIPNFEQVAKPIYSIPLINRVPLP